MSATLALKSFRATAGIVSCGRSILPDISIGTGSLPNEPVASIALAFASMSMCPSSSRIWNFSTARANVSDLTLPATNIVSTLRPILLRALFGPLLLTSPLNPTRVMSIIAKTVSRLSVYTMCGCFLMLILPSESFGRANDAVSSASSSSMSTFSTSQFTLPSA